MRWKLVDLCRKRSALENSSGLLMGLRDTRGPAVLGATIYSWFPPPGQRQLPSSSHLIYFQPGKKRRREGHVTCFLEVACYSSLTSPQARLSHKATPRGKRSWKMQFLFQLALGPIKTQESPSTKERESEIGRHLVVSGVSQF